jgi:hypothetical protein
MHCNGCNSDIASRTRTGISGGKLWEVCDICGKIPPVWNPDVYLGNVGGSEQTDENLCNPTTGVPYPFSTKREKAAIMRMLHLQQAESAEHVHGARNESHLHRKKYI